MAREWLLVDRTLRRPMGMSAGALATLLDEAVTAERARIVVWLRAEADRAERHIGELRPDLQGGVRVDIACSRAIADLLEERADEEGTWVPRGRAKL